MTSKGLRLCFGDGGVQASPLIFCCDLFSNCDKSTFVKSQGVLLFYFLQSALNAPFKMCAQVHFPASLVHLILNSRYEYMTFNTMKNM